MGSDWGRAECMLLATLNSLVLRVLVLVRGGTRGIDGGGVPFRGAPRPCSGLPSEGPERVGLSAGGAKQGPSPRPSRLTERVLGRVDELRAV